MRMAYVDGGTDGTDGPATAFGVAVVEVFGGGIRENSDGEGEMNDRY